MTHHMRERCKPLFARQTHHHGYRSGQWAKVTGLEWLCDSANQTTGRAVILVEFVDGVTDEWPLEDPAAGYEFAGTPN